MLSFKISLSCSFSKFEEILRNLAIYTYNHNIAALYCFQQHSELKNPLGC